jgi:hypothetical protein
MYEQSSSFINRIFGVYIHRHRLKDLEVRESNCEDPDNSQREAGFAVWKGVLEGKVEACREVRFVKRVSFKYHHRFMFR